MSVFTIEATPDQDDTMAARYVNIRHCTQPGGARTMLYCTTIEDSRIILETIDTLGSYRWQETLIDNWGDPAGVTEGADWEEE